MEVGPGTGQLHRQRSLTATESTYSAKDVNGMEEADTSWQGLQFNLGAFAVTDAEAVQDGVAVQPERLTSDPAKGIYTMESYHSMH